MHKLLVILGPTATGKTDLALSLAKRFNGELISCDSRQVFKNLDIGTGKKPSKISSIFRHNNYWIINGVKVWMYDVIEPKKQYSVSDYIKDANKVIEKIVLTNKLPIVVGGSGLYLKSLLYGLSNLGIPPNPSLRIRLEKLSKYELQQELQTVSFDRWKRVNKSDKENPRRLIRVIEIAIDQKFDRKTQIFPQIPLVKKYHIIKIGLTAPREILYRRADQRVLDRINQGMIEEASNQFKGGLSLERMRQLGLEYGVLADFLQGTIKDKDELVNKLQSKIRSFIRRQLTWFKKEKEVYWFDISSVFLLKKVEEFISKWYDKSDANQS